MSSKGASSRAISARGTDAELAGGRTFPQHRLLLVGERRDVLGGDHGGTGDDTQPGRLRLHVGAVG